MHFRPWIASMVLSSRGPCARQRTPRDMPKQHDEGATERLGIAGEKANDEKAGDEPGPGLDADTGGILGKQRTKLIEPGRMLRAGGDHGCDGPRPGGNGRPLQRGGDRAVKAKLVGENQAAVAADAPAIVNGTALHRLAHGDAAEDDRFTGD